MRARARRDDDDATTDSLDSSIPVTDRPEVLNVVRCRCRCRCRALLAPKKELPGYMYRIWRSKMRTFGGGPEPNPSALAGTLGEIFLIIGTRSLIN